MMSSHRYYLHVHIDISWEPGIDTEKNDQSWDYKGHNTHRVPVDEIVIVMTVMMTRMILMVMVTMTCIYGQEDH